MSHAMITAIIPAIVALLIIWLIYRIKKQLNQMIKNEIFGNFPFIKDSMTDLERRIDYLKTKIEALERKINETQNKAS